LLYSNNDTFSFEDVKVVYCPKKNLTLKCIPMTKLGLNVRGRPFGKEGTNRRSFHSKSRQNKSSEFCEYCKKQRHLVDEGYSLKNKRRKMRRMNNLKNLPKLPLFILSQMVMYYVLPPLVLGVLLSGF